MPNSGVMPVSGVIITKESSYFCNVIITLKRNQKSLQMSRGNNKKFIIMEKKKQNEELQSRREFFKEAAKKTLPVLAFTMLSSSILTSCEKDNYRNGGTGGSGGCNDGCSHSCSGSCNDTCSGSCESNCAWGCSYNCKGGTRSY